MSSPDGGKLASVGIAAAIAAIAGFAAYHAGLFSVFSDDEEKRSDKKRSRKKRVSDTEAVTSSHAPSTVPDASHLSMSTPSLPTAPRSVLPDVSMSSSFSTNPVGAFPAAESSSLSKSAAAANSTPAQPVPAAASKPSLKSTAPLSQPLSSTPATSNSTATADTRAAAPTSVSSSAVVASSSTSSLTEAPQSAPVAGPAPDPAQIAAAEEAKRIRLAAAKEEQRRRFEAEQEQRRKDDEAEAAKRAAVEKYDEEVRRKRQAERKAAEEKAAQEKAKKAAEEAERLQREAQEAQRKAQAEAEAQQKQREAEQAQQRLEQEIAKRKAEQEERDARAAADQARKRAETNRSVSAVAADKGANGVYTHVPVWHQTDTASSASPRTQQQLRADEAAIREAEEKAALEEAALAAATTGAHANGLHHVPQDVMAQISFTDPTAGHITPTSPATPPHESASRSGTMGSDILPPMNAFSPEQYSHSAPLNYTLFLPPALAGAGSAAATRTLSGQAPAGAKPVVVSLATSSPAGARKQPVADVQPLAASFSADEFPELSASASAEELDTKSVNSDGSAIKQNTAGFWASNPMTRSSSIQSKPSPTAARALSSSGSLPKMPSTGNGSSGARSGAKPSNGVQRSPSNPKQQLAATTPSVPVVHPQPPVAAAPAPGPDRPVRGPMPRSASSLSRS